MEIVHIQEESTDMEMVFFIHTGTNSRSHYFEKGRNWWKSLLVSVVTREIYVWADPYYERADLFLRKSEEP